jgi:hypothetical protein
MYQDIPPRTARETGRPVPEPLPGGPDEINGETYGEAETIRRYDNKNIR